MTCWTEEELHRIGGASFGGNERRARPPQLLLGPGEELTVTDAAPGTRNMLFAGGKPYR